MIMAEGKIWTSVVITETKTQSNSTTETFNNPEIFWGLPPKKNSPKLLFHHVFLPPELFLLVSHGASCLWVCLDPDLRSQGGSAQSDMRVITDGARTGTEHSFKDLWRFDNSGHSTEVIYSNSQKDFYSEMTRHGGREQERHADLECFPILLSELRNYFDHKRGKKNQDWIDLEFTECMDVFSVW